MHCCYLGALLRCFLRPLILRSQCLLCPQRQEFWQQASDPRAWVTSVLIWFEACWLLQALIGFHLAWAKFLPLCSQNSVALHLQLCRAAPPWISEAYFLMLALPQLGIHLTIFTVGQPTARSASCCQFCLPAQRVAEIAGHHVAAVCKSCSGRFCHSFLLLWKVWWLQRSDCQLLVWGPGSWLIEPFFSSEVLDLRVPISQSLSAAWWLAAPGIIATR